MGRQAALDLLSDLPEPLASSLMKEQAQSLLLCSAGRRAKEKEHGRADIRQLSHTRERGRPHHKAEAHTANTPTHAPRRALQRLCSHGRAVARTRAGGCWSACRMVHKTAPKGDSRARWQGRDCGARGSGRRQARAHLTCQGLGWKQARQRARLFTCVWTVHRQQAQAQRAF